MTLYPITRFRRARKGGRACPAPIRKGVQLECLPLAHPGGRTTWHGFRTDQAQDLSHHSRREPCSIVENAGLVSGRDHDRARRAACRRGHEQHQAAPCDPTCHVSRRTTVGQYVPFYFCPRSVMLYVLHRGNHPSLEYRGGQTPLVHLEADLLSVVCLGESRRSALGVQSLERGRGLYGLLCPNLTQSIR